MDGNGSKDHPTLSGEVVLARTKEFVYYYKQLEVTEIEGDLLQAIIAKGSAVVETFHSKLIKAQRELSQTETEQLP